jgi:hypothetical protein
MNGEIAVPSNVTRLSRAIKPISRDGIPQIVYYHFGVGGGGGLVDKIVGGMLLNFSPCPSSLLVHGRTLNPWV